MKKILLIPLDSHRVSEGIFDDMLTAFSEQFNAKIFTDLMDGRVFEPDYIFYQGGLTLIDLAYLKEHTGAKIIMWTGDARYMPTQSLINLRNVVDLYLLPFSGPTSELYQKILGKPCEFIWEPIQEWRFRRPNELQSGDTVFIGNQYDNLPGGRERRRILTFIHDLNRHLYVYGSMAVACNYGAVEYTRTPEIYNNAYIVICENNLTLQDYFTPRNIGAMAAGSVGLHRYFPGIEKHFVNMEDGLIYSDEYECLEAIEMLQKNPDIRNKIAWSSYKNALEKYTYSAWVKRLSWLISYHS